MDIQTSDIEIKAARVPHNLMMVNLIGVHILMFVVALGLIKVFWPLLAILPFISFAILGYILFQGRENKQYVSWFVMVNWKIAAKRSRIFLIMLLVCLSIASIGLYGYFQLHWMREAVLAVIGGTALLPVMATVLVLIILESDALDQVNLQRVSDKTLDKYPRPSQYPER